MATSNSKSFFDLPVTTQLFLLVGFLWKVQLLLIFNPITLFVLNIFKPRWARSMAHSDALYDKKYQQFFTEQAKEWPWHWAKWWYTSKELKDLPMNRQIDFYYDVDDSAKTLAAMSSEASFAVIDDALGNNFEGLKKNINEIKMSPELFRAFIAKSEKEDDMSTLSDYLKRGTLSKEFVECLADEAECSTAGIYNNTWLALIFYDYVERCGLGKDLLKNLLERLSFAKFKEEVEKRQNIYSQRVFTKSQRGSKSPHAWLHFCGTTKEICKQAQMEMGVDQYHVFHKTGHTLDAEAILHILSHYSDRTMAQLIFEYEPNFGIASDEVKELIDRKPELKNIFNDANIARIEKDLEQRIRNREELNIEELNQMFDCPNSNDLAVAYVSRYPLPKELHKRMLEQKNAGSLQFYISQGWLLSAYQLDDEVAEECKKLGYRLDPPEED